MKEREREIEGEKGLKKREMQGEIDERRSSEAHRRKEIFGVVKRERERERVCERVREKEKEREICHVFQCKFLKINII